jgi:hypothetical protein
MAELDTLQAAKKASEMPPSDSWDTTDDAKMAPPTVTTGGSPKTPSAATTVGAGKLGRPASVTAISDDGLGSKQSDPPETPTADVSLREAGALTRTTSTPAMARGMRGRLWLWAVAALAVGGILAFTLGEASNGPQNDAASSAAATSETIEPPAAQQQLQMSASASADSPSSDDDGDEKLPPPPAEASQQPSAQPPPKPVRPPPVRPGPRAVPQPSAKPSAEPKINFGI